MGSVAFGHRVGALRAELRTLRQSLDGGQVAMLAEIQRLRGLLRGMLDCPDPRCVLCARCLGAVQASEPNAEGRPVPVVTETDPIRRFRCHCPRHDLRRRAS